MTSLLHSDPAQSTHKWANSTAISRLSYPDIGDSRHSRPTTRILILYCSMSQHVDALARAMAAGAGAVEEVEVVLKRIPEITPRAERLLQAAPLAQLDELPDYDGIIFGLPTPSGEMFARIRDFLGQTDRLWMEGGLFSKVGSVFTSTTDLHGEQEKALTSLRTTLSQHGMIFVDAPSRDLLDREATSVSTPRGAALTGRRQPPMSELAFACFQGRYVAQMTKWLVRGNA